MDRRYVVSLAWFVAAVLATLPAWADPFLDGFPAPEQVESFMYDHERDASSRGVSTLTGYQVGLKRRVATLHTLIHVLQLSKDAGLVADTAAAETLIAGYQARATVLSEQLRATGYRSPFRESELVEIWQTDFMERDFPESWRSRYRGRVEEVFAAAHKRELEIIQERLDADRAAARRGDINAAMDAARAVAQLLGRLATFALPVGILAAYLLAASARSGLPNVRQSASTGRVLAHAKAKIHSPEQCHAGGGFTAASTTTENEIFLELPDGSERSYQLHNVGLSALPGHTVSLTWMAPRGKQIGHYVAAVNHSTGQTFANAPAIASALRPRFAWWAAGLMVVAGLILAAVVGEFGWMALSCGTPVFMILALFAGRGGIASSRAKRYLRQYGPGRLVV